MAQIGASRGPLLGITWSTVSYFSTTSYTSFSFPICITSFVSSSLPLSSKVSIWTTDASSTGSSSLSIVQSLLPLSEYLSNLCCLKNKTLWELVPYYGICHSPKDKYTFEQLGLWRKINTFASCFSAIQLWRIYKFQFQLHISRYHKVCKVHMIPWITSICLWPLYLYFYF